jgi:AraC-like DNA-binding protein
VTFSESGRHLATQMSLVATMIDTAAIETASLMAPVVVDLVRSLLHPGDQAAPARLARLMDISRGRLTDPGFDLAALARESRWSVRTVQAAFSAEGLSFSDWLTGERLELARAMLTDPVWETRSIAHLACAAGFTDTSTFFRAFRQRFGITRLSAHRATEIRPTLTCGTRTGRCSELAHFYEHVLGLRLVHAEADFRVFKLPDGRHAEIFGSSYPGKEHFATGQVVDFAVRDLPAAWTS